MFAQSAPHIRTMSSYGKMCYRVIDKGEVGKFSELCEIKETKLNLSKHMPTKII